MTSDALLNADLESPRLVEFCGGTLAAYSHRSPTRETENEDSAGWHAWSAEEGVLVVSDGAGGQAGGARASAVAVSAFLEAVRSGEAGSRDTVLGAIDAASSAISELKLGAAATLAVVQVAGREVRSYHVGDSGTLVFGQRGRRKFETIAHSPVGYAQEAGVIDEDEAMHHEDRHFVSNFLGTPEVRIDMSSAFTLAARDTVVSASDGLLDNLASEEIVQLTRAGTLSRCAMDLLLLARKRMMDPAEGAPSKPDDLTFLVFRPGAVAK